MQERKFFKNSHEFGWCVCFPKKFRGGKIFPPKWMVKISWKTNPMNKWMIWGVKSHYFWVETPHFGSSFQVVEQDLGVSVLPDDAVGTSVCFHKVSTP